MKSGAHLGLSVRWDWSADPKGKATGNLDTPVEIHATQNASLELIRNLAGQSMPILEYLFIGTTRTYGTTTPINSPISKTHFPIISSNGHCHFLSFVIKLKLNSEEVAFGGDSKDCCEKVSKCVGGERFKLPLKQKIGRFPKSA